jgi:hypothetical protein
MKSVIRTKDRVLVDDVKSSPVDRELAMFRAVLLGVALPIVGLAWLLDGMVVRLSGPGVLLGRILEGDSGL